ncbi:prephenate dehydrogenase/arogenate dehydrogenase family protein [Haloplanus halobius]|uniref:prephenate dehydrogenase/arogenate dehydrogenase family protein n=1 Tax=Haloplanus halobius TaxID=2934938 RepID=UPI00201057DE|nr:prephenate dehydrogenase/arogenate dehydrogenase family protein [Haloplanus sp. XH21]
MDLLVVGAGEMGRWVARTVARPVALADIDAAAAERAADDIDGVRAVPTDTTETFDAVCLAVPISAVADAIDRYAPRAERAMCDVTGVMAAPVDAMRDALPDHERVSMHPLFAASNAPGNVAVVADAPGSVTDAIRDDLAAAGNHLFETTVAEHDEAMETVQAGAHTAVLAYALAAADVREEFATPVSAALDDLVETVTGGTPRVYREIQETFEGDDDVAEAAKRVAEAEGEAFDDLYREAGE